MTYCTLKDQESNFLLNNIILGSSSSSKYVSTTTTTKTLVSLKSCRSVSEIETLPPSGYFASTVVQHKQTYVNDTFVSDNEDDECYSVSACCKER